METPRFTITPDLDRKFLHIVLRGFWDESTFVAYQTELYHVAQRMAAAGCPVKDLLALTDARQLGPQAQNLVVAFKDRFDTPERRPRRLATIVASALLKRQVERVAIPNQRIFSKEHEAMDWLMN